MDLKFKDNSKLKITPFTQLEYIENTGTQYIDTGVLTNPDLEFELLISNANNGSDTICGGRKTASSSRMIVTMGSDSIVFTYGNGSWVTGDAKSNYTTNQIIKIKYVGENNNTKVYKDGSLLVNVSGNYSTWEAVDFIIFGIFEQTNVSISTTCFRCHGFKIKLNNVVIRDFIPAKDSNNVVCLYDTVSKTFYYNQGTGDFVAGPVTPSTITSFPDNILLKTTTLYHKNTPNIDGLQLLNDILIAQETAEDVVLNRIRIDIGNVSGSFSELMQYSSMTGFNDAGEEQAKPRLVGTWVINDWYTQEQLAQARTAFDGLTIVPDTNYLINFDNLAVQVLDSTKPNYNPAVSIILQSKGLGVTMDSPVVDGQTGRWFLTKTQASNITDIGNWFKQVGSVVDSSAIVSSDATISYDLEEFDEFQYFTGITSLVSSGGASLYIGAMTMPKLKSIKLPSTLTTLQQSRWGESATFGGCSMLEEIDLSNITSYGDGVCANCISLRKVILPEIATVISSNMFMSCSNLEEIVGIDNITTIQSNAFGQWTIPTRSRYPGELPANIKRLEGNTYRGAFKQCRFTFRNIPASCTFLGMHLFMETGTPYLHLLGENPPQVQSYFLYNQNDVGTFYVGNSYKEKSRYVYEKYYDSSDWVPFRSKLKDWYYFAAPQISYDGEYVTMEVTRTSDIYYTLDGTVPTTSSTRYSNAFIWNGTGVIKAMAIDSNGDMAYADDFYATTVQNPVISNTSGQITISAESGATVYYTLDGTSPTLDSSIYSGPINTTELGDIVKVRCFAVKEDMNHSEVISKMYVMDDTLWGTDSDTSSFAVQCIDSTKPNYNPAVCIILHNNKLLTDSCAGGGGGYINKTDAAAVTTNQILRIFCNKATVVDTLKIVNSSGDNFDFETFHEFKYFTVFPNAGWTDSGWNGFQSCTKLRAITIPSNIDKIVTNGWSEGGFRDCVSLETVNMPNTITEIGGAVFNNCRKLKNISLPQTITSIGGGAFGRAGYDAVLTEDDYIDLNLPNLVTLGAGAFFWCKLIKKITNLGSITQLTHSNNNDGTFKGAPIIMATLPNTLTSMTYCIFADISNNAVIHLLSTTPPTILNTGDTFTPASVKLYVGDGSSAANDDATLQAYLADSNWNTYYSSRLDTWYNYLHPQI